MKIVRSIFGSFGAGKYSFVIYALAIAAVSYMVTSPLVADPILNFCLAGIVPVTHEVIAPSDMIDGVFMALGLIICAVLSYWLIKRIIVRRTAQRTIMPAAAAVPAEQPQPISAGIAQHGEGVIFSRAAQPAAAHSSAQLSAHTTAQRTTHRAFWAQISAGVNMLVRFGMRRSRQIGGATGRSGSAVYRAITTIARVGLRLLVTAGRTTGAVVFAAARTELNFLLEISNWMITASRKLTLLSVRAAKRARIWSVPHLRRIDTALELQYRTSSQKLYRFLMRYERFGLLLQMRRDIATSLRRRSK